jgi:hypothetical protein
MCPGLSMVDLSTTSNTVDKQPVPVVEAVQLPIRPRRARHLAGAVTVVSPGVQVLVEYLCRSTSSQTLSSLAYPSHLTPLHLAPSTRRCSDRGNRCTTTFSAGSPTDFAGCDAGVVRLRRLFRSIYCSSICHVSHQQFIKHFPVSGRFLSIMATCGSCSLKSFS